MSGTGDALEVPRDKEQRGVCVRRRQGPGLRGQCSPCFSRSERADSLPREAAAHEGRLDVGLSAWIPEVGFRD